MTTYISILRGINVSGHKIIKMGLLQKTLHALGFLNVQTYIQSGNIIFQFKETAKLELENLIQSAIKKDFEFNVPVLTFSAEEWINITNKNPFIKDSTKNSRFFHITFLSQKPKMEVVQQLKEIETQTDEYSIIENAVYLYCPNGYGNTKLNNSFFEKKLKVNATTRNWKTILALRSRIE